jgi:hypothetical protein
VRVASASSSKASAWKQSPGEHGGRLVERLVHRRLAAAKVVVSMQGNSSWMRL